MRIGIVCLATVGLIAVLGAPVQRTQVLDDTLQIRDDTFVRRGFTETPHRTRKPGSYEPPAACPFDCGGQFATPVRMAGHFIACPHTSSSRGDIPPDWRPPQILYFSMRSQGGPRSKLNLPPGETVDTMANFARIIKKYPAGATNFLHNCVSRIASLNRLIGSACSSMQHPAPVTNQHHEAVHWGIGPQYLHDVRHHIGSSRVVDAEHAGQSTEQATSSTSEHLRAVQFGATRAPDAERAGSSMQIPALPTSQPDVLPPPEPVTPEQYLDLFMKAYHGGPINSRAVPQGKRKALRA